MAEDQILEQTEDEYDQEELSAKQKQQQQKKCCNQRLDELATPNKRIFLALWNEHAHHLPKDKVNNVKQMLQQLYAMSPEETAKYFAELRAEAKSSALRKKLKQTLRRYLAQKHSQKQRERAYRLFKNLLKCGIRYAATHPVPPMLSLRLRYLSDVILEQLCDLRSVELPCRSNPDKLGRFLISVADWMAIAVERLYYAAQMSINEMTEPQEEQNYADETLNVPTTYEKFEPPKAHSTPKKGKKKQVDSFEGLKPVATSTPRGSKEIDVSPAVTKKDYSIPIKQKYSLELPPYSYRETALIESLKKDARLAMKPNKATTNSQMTRKGHKQKLFASSSGSKSSWNASNI